MVRAPRERADLRSARSRGARTSGRGPGSGGRVPRLTRPCSRIVQRTDPLPEGRRDSAGVRSIASAAGARCSEARNTPSVAAPRRGPPEWQEQLFFQRLACTRSGRSCCSRSCSPRLRLPRHRLRLEQDHRAENAFDFGKSGGGASISSLERKTQKNPLDAQAWRDLATAYETKQRTSDAIIALSQYWACAPRTQTPSGGARDRVRPTGEPVRAGLPGDPGDRPRPPHRRSLPSHRLRPSPFGKASGPEGAPGSDLRIAARTGGSAGGTPLSNYQTAQGNAEQTYQKLRKTDAEGPECAVSLSQSADAAGDTKVAVAVARP